MATESIFITWKEMVNEFREWRYAGDGVTVPTFDEKLVTRRCRYSSTVNDEMMARAKEYAATIEGRMDVRVEVLND